MSARWSPEQDVKLLEYLNAKKPIEEISKLMGKTNGNIGVRMKMLDRQQQSSTTGSTNIANEIKLIRESIARLEGML